MCASRRSIQLVHLDVLRVVLCRMCEFDNPAKGCCMCNDNPFFTDGV